MGSDYTVAHAAVLAAQLPMESRCIRADNPEREWTETEYMLAELLYGVAVLAWQRSKDGAKGINRPKRPMTPARRAEMDRRMTSTDFDYIDKMMKGDADGQ